MDTTARQQPSQIELEGLLPDEETMWQAFLSRDASFTGIFFTGVASTGIFCHPTCTARKPRRENVVFFRTASDAMRAGFRACRLCRPTEPSEETPPGIRKLLSDLEAEPERRIRDGELAGRGLDPGTVRRWFRKHHNLTFQGYQRLLRLNKAIRLLSGDEPVLDAALDSGYESLSGFSSAMKKLTAKSPSRSRDTRPITVLRLTTPLGPMFAGTTDRGLCLLEFTDRRMLETEVVILERASGSVLLPGTNELLKQVERELGEYFAGKRREFDVPLDPVGSEFQKSVWDVLRTIPYGELWSYRKQAEALGNIRFTRAVGQANGRNMISIVIPCHRVAGESGELVGYGGGLWRKRWLLDHERKHLS